MCMPFVGSYANGGRRQTYEYLGATDRYFLNYLGSKRMMTSKVSASSEYRYMPL